MCESEASTRIEHRQAGGDVNPYLAAAAALAGGLHGIEKGIEAPKLSDGDIYAMAPGEVPELPRSLPEATKLLQESQVARDWLGDDFVDHFVEMKRAECEAQMTAVTDWEIARYLEVLPDRPSKPGGRGGGGRGERRGGRGAPEQELGR